MKGASEKLPEELSGTMQLKPQRAASQASREINVKLEADGSDSAPPALQVDGSDVVRLMLQFLRENSLHKSLRALQDETGVPLDAVDSLADLRSLVLAGRWDAVLTQLGEMSLPPDVVMLAYEQATREMLELREADTALALLKSAVPLRLMRSIQPGRYARLESLVRRGASSNQELYPAGATRATRRDEVATAIEEHVREVPRGRLLAALGDALRWRRRAGLLPAGMGSRLDVFSGTVPRRRDAEELPASRRAGVVRFAKGTRALAACMSPTGDALVTGNSDGFVEIYDPESGSLRMDLEYQERDEVMAHESSVLCLDVSEDGELVAAGDKSGDVRVWRIVSGKCLRRFPKVHPGGVTSVAISRDSSRVLAGGFSGAVKVLGMRSGKQVRELQGHSAFVNSVQFSADGSFCLTASSDGTARKWNSATGEAVKVLRPPSASSTAEIAVVAALFVPRRGGLDEGAPGGDAAASGSQAAGMSSSSTSAASKSAAGGSVLVCPRGPAAFVLGPGGEVKSTLRPGPLLNEQKGGSGAGGGSKRSTAASSSSSSSSSAPPTLRDASEAARDASLHLAAATVGPQGKLAYLLADDGGMYVLDIASGKQLAAVQAAGEGAEPLGLSHHPHRNLVASYAAENRVRLWQQDKKAAKARVKPGAVGSAASGAGRSHGSSAPSVPMS